ncbi:MAG TPA: hypothetical protein VI756_07765 [Blastocatellia bacterium]
MGQLRVNDKGVLDISSVATLSRSEIADWVRRRLNGTDNLVASDVKQAEPSYYLLGFIYPLLDRDSRSYMRSVVEQFLQEMAHGDLAWRGQAGHSLLLLAQRLREPEFVQPVRKMAEVSTFFDQLSGTDVDSLHHRLLQTLVAFKWRGPQHFWVAQFDRGADLYGPVAFAGLSLISIRQAMELLPRMNWSDPSIKRGVRVALRGLLPGHCIEEIAENLWPVLPKIGASDSLIVQSMLPELPENLDPGLSLEAIEGHSAGTPLDNVAGALAGRHQGTPEGSEDSSLFWSTLPYG